MTLSNHLISNYAEHPAFKVGAPVFAVPDVLLSSFNESYLALSQMGSTLGSLSSGELQRTCLKALSEIFGLMSAQVADKQEAVFLAELRQECLRLIELEFAWYARKPHRSFVEVTPGVRTIEALQLRRLHHYFGCISTSVVSEILALGSEDLDKFRAKVRAGSLRREDLSINSGPVVWGICNVLHKEFKSLGVLDVVGSYMGRKTFVHGLALELSVPQSTWWRNAVDGLPRAPKTLYAHVDEGIQFPKSIVYLTDVSERNGPTGCYPGAYDSLELTPLQEIIGRVVGLVGSRPDSPLREYYGKLYHQSMNSERFRKHFMRLPESLRFNSHLGWDVLPNSELEQHLVSRERLMLGPSGTFIVFDGAKLLHRGGLVKEAERIALQVVFSDLPPGKRFIQRLKRAFR